MRAAAVAGAPAGISPITIPGKGRLDEVVPPGERHRAACSAGAGGPAGALVTGGGSA